MRKNSKVTNLKEYRNKKVDINNNKEKKRKENNPKKRKRFLVICVIFIFTTISFMHRYSVISNLEYKVQLLNKELEYKKNQKKQLEIDIDSLSKSGFIEDKARENLKMDYPKEEQTIYIKVD